MLVFCLQPIIPMFTQNVREGFRSLNWGELILENILLKWHEISNIQFKYLDQINGLLYGKALYKKSTIIIIKIKLQFYKFFRFCKIWTVNQLPILISTLKKKINTIIITLWKFMGCIKFWLDNNCNLKPNILIYRLIHILICTETNIC